MWGIAGGKIIIVSDIEEADIHHAVNERVMPPRVRNIETLTTARSGARTCYLARGCMCADLHVRFSRPQPITCKPALFATDPHTRCNQNDIKRGVDARLTTPAAAFVWQQARAFMVATFSRQEHTKSISADRMVR